ncbi:MULTISPECIES: L-threonylcarbamoyladenylate synthase [unclassified Methylobacterium]|jgi:L-threonylcarbamoyladenylate synthase|uniref:L-threonylcarbamoyladenylate synthase n=1 Tax=unclassified Methylobacterium TaxID=2615210 RepID=UPI0013531DA2|nr:L-threonylcarbamoyladenylate synthase [Methylobacterium sp. 2A]MWV21881.1 threonylcarbamoyl-AMP synthase [Methylobacterium sp. 2A]
MNDSGSTVPAATRRLDPDAGGLAEAAARLRAGALVAFPTETVYGLGADATDPTAVARIFAAKDRPRFNPLIAHLPDMESALAEGVFDGPARRLAETFWPGPLTLVVPAHPGTRVCDLARAGLPSVALRVPAHPLARALLSEVGRPVAAPSANRSGRVSPTRASHVLDDLAGRIAAVLDGGDTPVGVESTVVACLGGPPRLLRPGGITRAALRTILGHDPATPEPADADRPAGPGMLASHYAPRARVRLDATHIEPGEAVLLFGGGRPGGHERARAALNLSPTGNAEEAAARLFGALRELDASGAATIAVVPIPPDGLGEAIRDRLARAAAPR